MKYLVLILILSCETVQVQKEDIEKNENSDKNEIIEENEIIKEKVIIYLNTKGDEIIHSKYYKPPVPSDQKLGFPRNTKLYDSNNVIVSMRSDNSTRKILIKRNIFDNLICDSYLNALFLDSDNMLKWKYVSFLQKQFGSNHFMIQRLEEWTSNDTTYKQAIWYTDIEYEEIDNNYRCECPLYEGICHE